MLRYIVTSGCFVITIILQRGTNELIYTTFYAQ
jgi:hypothetical protein